jgi:hypothetical protein
MTSRTLGSSSTIRMRLTLWRPAAHDALPRVRSLRLHVLGQCRRGVDLLLDQVEVTLDLSRRDGAQSQAESHCPNAQFRRGQTIQDAVSKGSRAIAGYELFHL